MAESGCTALLSKLPCVPRAEPMRSVCLGCTSILLAGGLFAAAILGLVKAFSPGYAAPAPIAASEYAGGDGDEINQTGVFNIHSKVTVSLVLGGLAIAGIVLVVIYGAGTWLNRRPARMMRTLAATTREQNIDRELALISEKVAALSAAQGAPAIHSQPALQYHPPQYQPAQIGQVKYVSPTQPSMVPARFHGDFNSALEGLQEDRVVIPSNYEAGWVRAPRVQVSGPGARAQGVPMNGGGGGSQEQFADVEHGGAAVSTRLAT